ncbi:Serine/threonine-protein phosphatase 2A regulatory subunit B'' subunit alpha [Coemansia javaensis]|uniref:Serine/threonine-protein phosphatase 2A regulatory subunit B'' subunit alpha n=1 Tax=Coemansia javaensis TaxID=2761396 RepID=A0A9W8LII3_9FUNG|nr:Serine/threonine-protein phosphatase 2A regulatory subunit B'' subunit alpha [Coemansia javaensis]
MSSPVDNAAAMTTPQRKPAGAADHALHRPGISSPILQADELSLNPRWSPQLKSPRPSSTIASRLKQQKASSGGGPQAQAAAGASPLAPGDGGMGGMGSPLSKRARILQTGSPESLPPLSPVVSSRKRAPRGELGPDAPQPFSPNASALRIRYAPPSSPTLRSTPSRAEPESPTLTRILAADSPGLSLDEKLGAIDESPTVSHMSRSLLFRLDLESPSVRKAAPPESPRLGDLSPLAGAEHTLRHSSSPLLPGGAAGDAAGERPGAQTEPQRRRRRLGPAAVRAPGVPQIFVSPLHPRMDPGFEHLVAQELEPARKHFDRSFGAREVDFAKVTRECGLPRFANRALFRYVTRGLGDAGGLGDMGGGAQQGLGAKRGRLADREAWPSFAHFSRVWLQLRRASPDVHALVFNVLADDPAQPRAHLTRDDIKVLVSDVVDHHYELEFLEGQDQFLQSYAETVVERIFYVANRTWDGRLVLSQFRRADIVGMLRAVEDGIDVGVESPGVFSYKHFYVLFCSFFELDTNRDSLLDARDLLRYFNGTLSRRAISRIMMGKGRPSEHVPRRAAASGSAAAAADAKAKAEKRKAKPLSRYDLNVRLSDCRMTYRDFIWFLLSEIDKTTPTAVEYWFRCLDLDGDGVLSIYELEYFYDEQLGRMEEDVAGDTILLDDLMCQLSDLVRPEREGLITLKDLRRTPPALVPVFFDAFMNLTRFLEHDSRTSFLQRQLAQLSMRALPTTSFPDVIQMRMDFLASIPNPWIEFADLEYAALLNDHEQADSQAASATTDSALDAAAAAAGTAQTAAAAAAAATAAAA